MHTLLAKTQNPRPLSFLSQKNRAKTDFDFDPMKTTKPNRSKFVRIMKLPIRALSRARDYYVRRMVDCGQVSRCPGAHGVGGGGIGLPRSFSVAASSSVSDCDNRSEDFKELVRAASVRTLAANGGGVNKVRVLRSASVGVGMGRIDEDDDDEDEHETRKLRVDGGGNVGGRKQSVAFWRSKSLAVTNML